MTVRKPALSVLAAFLFVGLLGATLLAGFAAPASAVEAPGGEEAPPPDIEELCREGSVAAEFCPDPYEEPSWFQWLIYPLLIVGLLMAAVMLFAYLTWHPRFATEAEEKKKSRR